MHKLPSFEVRTVQEHLCIGLCQGIMFMPLASFCCKLYKSSWTSLLMGHKRGRVGDRAVVIPTMPLPACAPLSGCGRACTHFLHLGMLDPGNGEMDLLMIVTRTIWNGMMLGLGMYSSWRRMMCSLGTAISCCNPASQELHTETFGALLFRSPSR